MVHCGLILGACAVAVFAAVRRHRHGYGHLYAYGGGCGGGTGGCHGPGGCGPEAGGCGGGFRRRGFGGGFRFRAILRGLFMRLETTPGQEKAIMSALGELREAAAHAKGEVKGSRKDFADAFRRGPIDEAAMADIFVRHDAVISETRRKAVEAVGKIHDALDDRQRAEVADLIEQGPGFWQPWHGRPGYRW